MPRILTVLAVAAAVLVGPVGVAAAAPAPTVPAHTVPLHIVPARTVPAPTVPAGSAPFPAAATCVDTAGALSAATCARITAVLQADERVGRDSDQIAVVVVRSTGAASIEDWSTALFNRWGVGRAGIDNGVLLVVALDDRTLRIATGDGLRTRLPDGTASEIIGGTITPLLRLGRTEDAVLAGLDGIRTALGHDVTTRPLAAPGSTAGLTDPDPFSTADDEEPADGGSGGVAALWILLLVGIIVVGVLSNLMRGGSGGDPDDSDYSGRRRAWSSSSSSRRSFSSSSSRRSSSSSRRSSGFGGGRSSGGGASGRW